MSTPDGRPEVAEVRDFYGRPYRVGETDRDLLGRSRSRQLLAAWLAMLMASTGQYGFGALMPALDDTHGWSLIMGGWLFAVWLLCQSAAVYPTARVRVAAGITPATALITGAVLCAAGLATLGLSSNFGLVLLVHGVLGGIGAGLIYGTSVDVASRWYPERPSRTAVASGAFAYGAVPFIVLAGWFAGPSSLGPFLVVAAVAIVAVVGVSATILRDPPAHWWPSHIDPKKWAMDKSVNPALRSNKPAARTFTPGELVGSAPFAVLFCVVSGATAVALFTIAYLAVFASTSGWSTGLGVAAVAALAAASGATRTVAGRAGEVYGRIRVVRLALYAAAAAQMLLLLGGGYGLAVVLLLGAGLAGAAAGTCIALLPSLVEVIFGELRGLPNFGLFYAAKAVGGVLGVALAGHGASAGGFEVMLFAAAVVSLVAAGSTRWLRQPGRSRVPAPTGTSRAVA